MCKLLRLLFQLLFILLERHPLLYLRGPLCQVVDMVNVEVIGN